MELIYIGIFVVLIGLKIRSWVNKYQNADIMNRPHALMTDSGIGCWFVIGILFIIGGLVILIIGISKKY